MAYSRFSESNWYVYWHAAGEGKPKNQQSLRIHHISTPGIDFCFGDNVDNFLTKVYTKYPGVTVEELKELRTFIDQFCEDVEREY